MYTYFVIAIICTGLLLLIIWYFRIYKRVTSTISLFRLFKKVNIFEIDLSSHLEIILEVQKYRHWANDYIYRLYLFNKLFIHLRGIRNHPKFLSKVNNATKAIFSFEDCLYFRKKIYKSIYRLYEDDIFIEINNFSKVEKVHIMHDLYRGLLLVNDVRLINKFNENIYPKVLEFSFKNQKIPDFATKMLFEDQNQHLLQFAYFKIA